MKSIGNMWPTWVIIYFVFLLTLFIVFITFVAGYQIIPEDDLENKTLEFCESFNQTENFTLSCMDFFNDYAEAMQSRLNCTTVYENNTIYVNTTINNTYIYNNTIIYNKTYVYNHTYVTNNTIYIDDKADAEQQAKRDHEFRMRQLELGVANETEEIKIPAGYVSQKDVDIMISEAISKANPPPTELPAPKEFKFENFLIFFLVVGAGGFFIYKIVKERFFKKKLPPMEHMKEDVLGDEKSQTDF